jgi:hypothetical protein
MKNLKLEDKEVRPESGSILNKSLRRRSFLQYAGAGAAGVALLAAGCKKESDFVGPVEPPVVPPIDATVSFGTGDIAVLNYAFALEQLEAAFYTEVAKSAAFTGLEKEYLIDIQQHEIAHRDVLKAALSTNAIGTLTFDFATIDFTNRTKLLETAKAFEDLGVSAYNGVAYLLKSTDYLSLAAKIVSVEARHAAFIREALLPNSFGTEVVNTSGLDTSRSPAQVWAIASKYIKNKVNTNTLPA